MDFENVPHEELMHALATMSDPLSALTGVLQLAYERYPLPVLKRAWPELASDIQQARSRIRQGLADHPRANGIYLGLDTLTMQDGQGTNIEMGFSDAADMSGSPTDWTYGDLDPGAPWLMQGIFKASTEYDQLQADDRWFAEYVIFLSYSGVVLGAALQQELTTRPSLVIWGFRDADLFKLARSDGHAVVLNPFPDFPIAD
jgi:hypothetical protein